MVTVTLDQQTYQLPQAWPEVNASQLPRLIQLVYLTPESPAMYHELIQVALSIKPKVWQKLMKKHFNPRLPESRRTANAGLIHQLVQALRWLWQQPMEKQPFEFLTAGGFQLFLPDENFATMSYGELTDGYIHFMVFIRQLVAGDEHLNLLVATLCRPRRKGNYTADTAWNGDHREDYNEYKAKERAKSVATLPYENRMAVLLYFAASFKAMMNRYAVFQEETAQDAQPSQPGRRAEQYPGQSMLKNQHLLAEKHIFGSISQTKTANAHEVLLYLEEHRKDLLAQIERQKQAHESN